MSSRAPDRVIASEEVRIELPGDGQLSGIFDIPERPQAAYVFAHGAGAGMNHRFMHAFAAALCGRGIAVLR